MKILILGAAGLLGQAITHRLKDGKSYTLLTPTHSECDIINEKQLKAYIAGYKPDFVINCAAYIDVERAEEEQEAAYAGNVIGPRNIAQILAADSSSAPLLHISTDYVFDGEKVEGYAEDDVTGPINIYGKTKLGGEEEIRRYLPQHYIVRTAWLYGAARKNNCVDRVIDGSKGKNEIRIVDDQIGCPTFVDDLAEGLLPFFEGQYPFGTYHLANDGFCSRYELAKTSFDMLGLPVRVIPAKSADFATKARRPRYSILQNNKLPKLRNWKEALSAYLEQKVVTYEAL